MGLPETPEVVFLLDFVRKSLILGTGLLEAPYHMFFTKSLHLSLGLPEAPEVVFLVHFREEIV